MKQGYFITATDTGAGKTLITCALLRQMARQGHAAIGMKPVAAGCAIVDGRLVNDDVEALRGASSVAVDGDDICPYLLPAAIAPHIAAADAAVHIELAVILNGFRALAARADVLVVEGIGGFRVPLNARHDTADLAALLGLPVILVVAMRLGCLNHALLTAEAIRARGLSLAGWVANHIDPAMDKQTENVDALQARLDCPLLARVPFFDAPDASHIELRL